MSGTQVSSFYPVNQLLQDNAQQITNYYAPQRNELLIQKGQQEVNAQEMEFASRAALGLLNLPDEAAMAAAYPGVVAEGQRYGFLKNAPSVFPGKARLQQIASYGIPAEKQFEQQGVRSAADAIRAGLSGGVTSGGTTAAPGGGAASSLPIPARGTGGPGTDATVPTEWLPYFYEASRETGIPVEMLIAQARQESSFNPNAKGASGEIGMFQIKPSTAQSPGFGLAGVDPATLIGPENVRNNILFGARYLRARGGAGDPNNPAWQANALRAYNAGGDPNYVANVNRYRPGLAPSDPAAAVTTYMPGSAPTGGVAARTGGTDVAGPPGTVPAPPGTTPAAPAQPAATTTAQGTAPAQQPPAAPAAVLPAPPPPLGADGLNAEQRQTVNGMLSTARTAAQLQQVQAQMQTYRDHNDTVQRQYQADVRLAQKDALERQDKAQSQANEAERIRLQQEGVRLQQDEATRKQRFEGAPTGYQWNDKGVLVRSPGYEGDKEDERIAYRLEHGDPSSPQYASDYAAMKWKIAPNGNVIENDMSQYAPPARGIQRPTFIPQPTGQALDEVRKADTDARVIVPAIDHYVDVFKETGGQNWGAYFDNTADPKSQRLLGAFDALRTVLRSPTYYNTGVLQPAEMAMIKQDLVSPQSIRGLWATPQALETRLHEIKLAVLRRKDAELRSVGKDGVIVRNPAERAKLPDGAEFYDEDGNLRIKRRTE